MQIIKKIIKTKVIFSSVLKTIAKKILSLKKETELPKEYFKNITLVVKL